MVDHVVEIVRQLGPWAYLIVYLVVMLECQPFLGLFMPGETLVVASGFLAREGVFELRLLIVVVAAAAIIGDTIGYELGRRSRARLVATLRSLVWRARKYLAQSGRIFRSPWRQERFPQSFPALFARLDAIHGRRESRALFAFRLLQHTRLRPLGHNFCRARIFLRSKLGTASSMGRVAPALFWAHSFCSCSRSVGFGDGSRVTRWKYECAGAHFCCDRASLFCATALRIESTCFANS